MVTLRLYIDESWPERQKICDWALDDSGRIVGRGRTAPEHWPLANHAGEAIAEVEIALEPSQYSVHQINLPSQAKQPLNQLAGYALEDRLLEPPERYHFVALRHGGKDAATCVVAILASRLTHILSSLKSIAGLPAPRRVIPMHELLPAPEQAWLLWPAPGRRFLLHGQTSGTLYIDHGDDLASLLATAGGNAPTCIRLIGEASEPMPVSVPIEQASPFDWASADWEKATNLLSGGFRPIGDGATWKAWRRAAVWAGALIAAHGVLSIGEWIWLASREKALKTEIRQLAGKALPGEPVIAPLAQIAVAADRERHRHGKVGYGDFLAMTRMASDVLGADNLTEMAFAPGRMEFRYTELPPNREQAAREAFARAGMEVRVARGAEGIRLIAAWMAP